MSDRVCSFLIMSGMVAIAVLLCVVGVDYATAKSARYSSGYVTEKRYVPATSSSGFATVMGSDGKLGTAYVSSSEPDKWVLIVRFGDHTRAFPVDADSYGNMDIGSQCNVFERRGRLFHYGFWL